MRFTKAFIPLLVFLALAGIFALQLKSGDPAKLPSALMGKNAPDFTLPALEQSGVPGLSRADLGQGQVALVNVFASWCVPCRDEHPTLMALAQDKRFHLYGINHKDAPENAVQFLRVLGNPYTRIGADMDRRASIEWGVYGVPETFVIARNGRIAYKHVGPLTPQLVQTKLMPAIEAALKE